jgi:hypothetical protein
MNTHIRSLCPSHDKKSEIWITAEFKASELTLIKNYENLLNQEVCSFFLLQRKVSIYVKDLLKGVCIIKVPHGSSCQKIKISIKNSLSQLRIALEILTSNKGQQNAIV